MHARKPQAETARGGRGRDVETSHAVPPFLIIPYYGVLPCCVAEIPRFYEQGGKTYMYQLSSLLPFVLLDPISLSPLLKHDASLLLAAGACLCKEPIPNRIYVSKSSAGRTRLERNGFHPPFLPFCPRRLIVIFVPPVFMSFCLSLCLFTCCHCPLSPSVSFICRFSTSYLLVCLVVSYVCYHVTALPLS